MRRERSGKLTLSSGHLRPTPTLQHFLFPIPRVHPTDPSLYESLNLHNQKPSVSCFLLSLYVSVDVDVVVNMVKTIISATITTTIRNKKS